MSGLIRGKLGGLVAFLLIAALVLGGLGGATHEALRLEESQRIVAAQTDAAERLRREQNERADKMRLALWRLDSRLAPALAREDSRPYPHYAALHSPFPALTAAGTACAPGQVYIPSPLLSAELPEWMSLHFQIDKNGWMSPQVIPAEVQRMLRKQPIELALNNVTPEREKLLNRLSKTYTWSFVHSTFPERLALDNFPYTQDQQQANFNNDGQNGQQLQNPGGINTAPNQGAAWNSNNPQGDLNSLTFQEFLNRTRVMGRGSREAIGSYQTDARQYFSATNSYPSKTMILTEQPVEVALGSMKPIWLPNAKSPEHLLLVRATQAGKHPLYQGIVLDWAKVQAILKEEIGDLFTDAKLIPVPAGELSRPERAMTTLPVELEPSEAPLPDQPDVVTADQLPPAGWTPLRIGLAFAWVAAVVALLAVGLGGWSLIDLSERRIRFVSAVTHELRTPLTTLRLYLDLLTSGMVGEGPQREEYLKTMHGETDRLNRLIGNVLDFARLEKQRPSVEKRPVPVSDLLEQLRQMWVERCAASGKDLTVVNNLPADASICTDRSLVEQIVGNLIDNARKYSRDAVDTHVWLRAVQENGRIVIEVEDRGPGVTKSERGSIFRPFRRGDGADAIAGGVGLGLALATRWACLIGARLTVRAGASGIGACFRLEL